MRPLRRLRSFTRRTPPALLAAILTVVASVVALHVVRVSTAHEALSLYGPVIATIGAVTAAWLASSVEPRGLIVPPSRVVTWLISALVLVLVTLSPEWFEAEVRAGHHIEQAVRHSVPTLATVATATGLLLALLLGWLAVAAVKRLGSSPGR